MTVTIAATTATTTTARTMTTEPPAAPRTRRTRRHPAAVSRISVAGVSAAATFGLVAWLGATADRPDTGVGVAGPEVASSGLTAPEPVVVVRRTIVRSDDGREVITSESPVLTGSPREVEPVTESGAS